MKRKELGIAIGIILCTGLSLVILSGSLMSGYHFMDCHEYITCLQELGETSWWEVLRQRIEWEAGMRFRPAWMLNTIFETSLFGDDLFKQGLWQITQIIAAGVLIYLLGRRLCWTHGESLLLTGLTLLGTQSAVFYQTLAIETTAFLLLLISWHLLLNCVSKIKMGGVKILSYIGFIISSTLMALMKENFILVLPASYILYIMVYAVRNETRFWETVMSTWKTGLFYAP
jgi:hypothetical protein